MSFGTRRKAIALRMVSGPAFKAELYRALALARPTDEEITVSGFPAGYVHVPDYMDAEWCRQLVAEQLVRTKTGKWQWQPEHQRNEALDCWVYSRAMLWTMGVAAWRPSKWKTLRERRGLDVEVAEHVDAPRLPSVAAPLGRPVQRPSRRGPVRSSFMS